MLDEIINYVQSLQQQVEVCCYVFSLALLQIAAFLYFSGNGADSRLSYSWWDHTPSFVRGEYLCNRTALPNYRFCQLLDWVLAQSLQFVHPFLLSFNVIWCDIWVGVYQCQHSWDVYILHTSYTNFSFFLKMLIQFPLCTCTIPRKFKKINNNHSAI